jgi:GMP synthase (glutamine-hydrolysing)
MNRTQIHLVDVSDFRLPDGSCSADWFSGAFEILGISGKSDLIVHDGTGGRFPDPAVCARPGSGVIVSGSYGPVWEDKEWIPPLMDFIRDIHGRNGWFLGVCFGHQALAWALGGNVEMNSRGREMGTVPIFLTGEGEKSPLFEGFASGDLANLVHRTHVTSMPEGGIRLAYNQMTPTQAFVVGRSFGFQPHPEMTPAQMRLLTDMYGSVLVRKEGFLDNDDHLRNFRDSFRETPSSMAVLRNYVEMIHSEL